MNSLGHCAECHSPRNFLGGIIKAQRFAGGPNPESEGWVPNITQKGIGEWSVKDIDYFLETGQTPDGDSAGGSMVRVIKNTSQLPTFRSRLGIAGLSQIIAAGGGTAAAREGGKGGAVRLRRLPNQGPLKLGRRTIGLPHGARQFWPTGDSNPDPEIGPDQGFILSKIGTQKSQPPFCVRKPIAAENGSSISTTFRSS